MQKQISQPLAKTVDRSQKHIGQRTVPTRKIHGRTVCQKFGPTQSSTAHQHIKHRPAQSERKKTFFRNRIQRWNFENVLM